MRFFWVDSAVNPTELREVFIRHRLRQRKRWRQKMASIYVFHLGIMAQQKFPTVHTYPHVMSNLVVWIIYLWSFLTAWNFSIIIPFNRIPASFPGQSQLRSGLDIKLACSNLRQRMIVSLINFGVVQTSHELNEFIELAGSDCNHWIERAPVEHLLESFLRSFRILFI